VLQDRGADPYVQQRIGRMAVDLETAGLWLTHVARLWDRGSRDEAKAAGVRARHLIEHLALAVVDNCVRACGSRSLIRPSPVERLLAPLGRDARLVTVMDGHPLALSWLGSVLGHRVVPLGIESFGQSGDIPDLYRTYKLDSAAIIDAVARAIG